MAVAGPAPSPAMRRKLAGIAAAHEAFVARRLASSPFDPEGRKEGSDYNQHFADLESDDDTFHAQVAAALRGRSRQVSRADHGQLKNYWLHGEGAAKWVASPHPWTSLYNHLKKHMPNEMAKRVAAEWFHERFGFWPGSDANRVVHGKPPRGDKVGPG